jgi:hypothetical protein
VPVTPKLIETRPNSIVNIDKAISLDRFPLEGLAKEL